MKKILFLILIVASAAACASEKKQANASENPEMNTEETTSTAVASTEEATPVSTVSDTNSDTEVAGDSEDRVILSRSLTFEQVLSKYEGKVIYIDFWASWCPPCRGEMPYSKELHGELEGKDVVFLYVSFDRSEKAWTGGIEKLDIQGVHFFPQQDVLKSLASQYDIAGIPRYMLVSREGKVVNPDAPRPSSGEVIKGKITELL